MSETKIVKTTCSTCGPCCEVDAYVKDGKLISVEGSRNTPMQSGGLCAKGVAATQYVYNKERILYPMKRTGRKGEGKFERISWDEAYEMIAEELNLRYCNRHIFQLSKEICKLHPDKLDVLLLDQAEDLLSGVSFHSALLSAQGPLIDKKSRNTP